MKTKIKYIILIVAIAIIGICKVNASEIITNVSYLDEQNFEITSDTNYFNTLDYYTFNLNGDNSSHRIQIYPKEYINAQDFDYIQFNYIASNGFRVDSTTQDNEISYSYCTEWSKNTVDNSYTCTEYQTDYNPIQDYESNISFYDLTNFINVYAVTNDGIRLNCSVKGNNILCPTKNKIISQITIDYSFNGANTQTKFYFYNRYSKFISDSNKINNTINNQTNKINDTLKQDKEYNKNASENIQGKEEIDKMDNKEKEIFNSLDFSGINATKITINPNTSSFIWSIANRLRGMSEYIILLITSVLGIGIIKMVLNR